MKRVLWISRHQMTREQREDLEEILGDTVVLVPWTDTVHQIEALLPMVIQADAVAAVLPVQLLALLHPYCGDRPLLQSVSQRVATDTMRTLPNGQTEPEFQFRHIGWQQIYRLELETRMLSHCEKNPLPNKKLCPSPEMRGS